MSMKKALVVALTLTLTAALVKRIGLVATAIAPVVVLALPVNLLLMLLTHFMTMRQCPILDGALAQMAIPAPAIRRLTVQRNPDDPAHLIKSQPVALAPKSLLHLQTILSM